MYMNQKLTTYFLKQEGIEQTEEVLNALKLGIICFNFEQNMNKIVGLDLAKFQMTMQNNDVFRFRDPNQKSLKNAGPPQKYIELHVRDGLGKFNSQTGIQADVLGHIPLNKSSELIDTTTGPKWMDQIQYYYDALKSPAREHITISKGTSNFTMYLTSQQNDALDLSKALYIFIEFDVYYY